MRPYLAIIEDSFREAISSRVLWVLLAVNLLVLLCLIPFGYLEQSKVELEPSDLGTFENRAALISKIADASQKSEPSPGKHIFSLFDDKTKERLNEVIKESAKEDEKSAAKEETARDDKAKTDAEPRRRGGGGGNRDTEFLAEQMPRILSKTLRNKKFYDEKSWEKVTLGEEAKELKKKGLDKLSTEELGRFNRLALEAAFRESLAPSRRTTFTYTLFGYDIGSGSMFQDLDTRAKFDESLTWWVRFLLAWFVGAIGVFISILITASIVPDTFDAGSLHLLLSKPLTRSMLFLSKFTGACVFTLLSACVLLGGVTLLLGLRFGVWNPRLLLCIPIYVFVFAIYYSVSAFIGLAFRSQIISIISAVIFWLVCFALGFGPYWMRDTVLRQVRIARLVPINDSVMGVSEVYTTRVWNEEKKQWSEAFNNDGRGLMQIPDALMSYFPFTILPPTGISYDSTTQQLVSVETVIAPGSFISHVNYGKAPEFKQVEGPNAPLGAITLLPEVGGKFVIVAQSGIFRGEMSKLQPGQNRSSVFGFNLGGGTTFENVGPKETLTIDRPAQAALDHAAGRLVIYSRGAITTLKRNEAGKFEVAKTTTLAGLTEEQKTDQGAAISVGGDCLLVALQSGRLLILDADTLEVTLDAQPQSTEQPRTVCVSPDGKAAVVLFHNGRLMISRAGENGRKFSQARVRGQGDISAAVIVGADTLYVADLTQRVTKYKLADLTQESEFGPSLDWFEISYRYGVAPLYKVFPKPGELEKTIRYVLEESPSQASKLAKYDLMAPPVQKSNPWSPVVSSGIFLLVMLAFSCFYIERQEY
jgi:hypothetical protein